MIDLQNQDVFTAQPLSNDVYTVGALTLRLLPTTGKLVLRGNPKDTSFTKPVEKIIGCSLPTNANTAVPIKTGAVLWRGPDEWLIEMPLDQIETCIAELETALTGQHISIVDITDAFSVIRISGQGARNVLSSGCSLNLNKGAFDNGQCAQSHYYKAAIILRFVDQATTFDVFVRRSETEYLWKLLKLACQTTASE